MNILPKWLQGLIRQDIVKQEDQPEDKLGELAAIEKMLKQEPAKLTNERANLRQANTDNAGERCRWCRYFEGPKDCVIIEGPVDRSQVCDWIQSPNVADVPRYEINEAEWKAFMRGVVAEQPNELKVLDSEMTPAGPLLMLEDSAETPHRFSASREFYLNQTNLNSHWTQAEVDRLVEAGQQNIEKQIARFPLQIIKQEAEQRIAIGIVMEPETTDAHGDVISAVEIEKSMYHFMENWQQVDFMHDEEVIEGAKIVMSYIAPVDFELGEQQVKKGSWVLGVRFPEIVWNLIKQGLITGFSPGGLGFKIPIAVAA